MIQSRIALTVALMAYDHVYEIRARDNDYEIRSGAVEIASVEPTFVDLDAPHSFAEFAGRRDWDVSDMPLVEYLERRLDGDARITALPVFTSRMFVHDCILVRRDRIATPGELRGARIGTAAWHSTQCVYARGMLRDMYGLAHGEMTWVREPQRALEVLLRAGELDAVIAPPHELPPAPAGDPAIGPLFERRGEAERQYLAKTGVFPILRVLGVRTEVLERHRWIASNIYRALEVARRRYFARLDDIRGSRAPVPSIDAHLRGVREAFGGEFWPYGLSGNRASLQALVRYAAEQGLFASADLKLEDHFARVEPFVDKL
ncbi:MAG: hypothetical protein IT514_07920 [Burkholderiales bacterium]|nr:hypothetical protein [Burkholderiales bacterium]